MLTSILIDNQYAQNVIFSSEKSSNDQNDSLTDSWIPPPLLKAW